MQAVGQSNSQTVRQAENTEQQFRGRNIGRTIQPKMCLEHNRSHNGGYWSLKNPQDLLHTTETETNNKIQIEVNHFTK